MSEDGMEPDFIDEAGIANFDRARLPAIRAYMYANPDAPVRLWMRSLKTADRAFQAAKTGRMVRELDAVVEDFAPCADAQPCPFCGARAALVGIGSATVVVCVASSAWGGLCPVALSAYGQNDAEALAAWNRRA